MISPEFSRKLKFVVTVLTLSLTLAVSGCSFFKSEKVEATKAPVSQSNEELNSKPTPVFVVENLSTPAILDKYHITLGNTFGFNVRESFPKDDCVDSGMFFHDPTNCKDEAVATGITINNGEYSIVSCEDTFDMKSNALTHISRACMLQVGRRLNVIGSNVENPATNVSYIALNIIGRAFQIDQVGFSKFDGENPVNKGYNCSRVHSTRVITDNSRVTITNISDKYPVLIFQKTARGGSLLGNLLEVYSQNFGTNCTRRSALISAKAFKSGILQEAPGTLNFKTGEYSSDNLFFFNAHSSDTEIYGAYLDE